MNNNDIRKLDMKSLNNINDNIEKIAELFPNVIREGKIDFESLRQELHDEILDNTTEKYQMNWVGKKAAIVEANLPITKTLRPIKQKSVNFENTKNIYIEGDNLEALKIIQESYLRKIKCIYIDPPYNTGNDFIYNDNFSNSAEDELFETNQIDEYGQKLITNIETNGRFHSIWLSMMYSRLKIARNLLSDDGVIFISNDENEYCNLKKLCDEIFGERNFIENFIWEKNSTKNNSTTTSTNHEYILCFAKNIENIKNNALAFRKKKDGYDFLMNFIKSCKDKNITISEAQNQLRTILKEHPEWKGLQNYKHIDENYNIYREDNVAAPGGNGKIYDIIHPVTGKICKKPDGGWRYTQEKMDYLVNNNLIVFGKDETKVPQFKRILENMDTEVAKSIITDNTDGINELTKIFNINNLFDNPKPTTLIKYLISMVTEEDDIILDFFSGSATTAEAVNQLNIEDNGKRKYILIQIPQLCDQNSVAYKNGFKNICDIGEERIRKVKNDNIDYGFRVYKIDSSNMRDIYYEPSKLIQNQLNIFETNIKEDRNSEDLLTQVLLDLGLTLDLKIEEKSILNNKVYFVAINSLVACFDDKINIDIINQICEIKPMKVVFRESSFRNDSDKINAFERIKKLSPETEISVI